MRSSSEDESSEDNGEKLRNVRSLLVKSSENRSGIDGHCVFKRTLGDLIFDANFEGGNLGVVEQIDRFCYDLMVRPDVANPRFRLWFNFTVSNQRPGQCVVMSLVNFSENLSYLFNSGMTPVVRSRLYPNWVRLEQDQVFYYRSPDHNNRLILSIGFKFAATSARDNHYQFALVYPYTITNLTNFLNRWSVELKRLQQVPGMKSTIGAKKTTYDLRPASVVSTQRMRTFLATEQARSKTSLGFTRNQAVSLRVGEPNKRARGDEPHFVADVLTESILSKPVYKIKVEQGLKFVARSSKTTVVVILRQSGNLESVASIVCQGLLDFMLSNHSMARLARSCFDLVALPMLDPDSSWCGNSRSDIFGQVSPSEKIIEANKGLYKNFIKTVNSANKICNQAKRVILLELRVNFNLIGSRVVSQFFDETFRMERHLHVPRLFAKYIDGFDTNKCKFVECSEDGLFSFHRSHDHVDQHCLEISPFAFHKKPTGELVVYDQRKYLTLGKAIAHALLESTTCGTFSTRRPHPVPAQSD